MTHAETVAPGYSVRNPGFSDIPAVTGLIRSYDLALQGSSHFTEDELLVEWKRPDFNPETDAWIIETPDGHPAGFQSVVLRSSRVDFMADGYVHPDHHGRGIGTFMLRTMETRVRQMLSRTPPGRRITIRSGVMGSDAEADRLFRNEGHLPLRYFREMCIRTGNGSPAPVWPEGIHPEPFGPDGDTRKLFDALEEAFRDHWGYTVWDYDWWLNVHTGTKSHDPGLWVTAYDGAEIAGAAVCTVKDGIGWVSQLGVRPPWRKRGLGLALLREAFSRFASRGIAEAALGVDAASPTGATRLYERVGMQVSYETTVFEKVIRPGD